MGGCTWGITPTYSGCPATEVIRVAPCGGRSMREGHVGRGARGGAVSPPLEQSVADQRRRHAKAQGLRHCSARRSRSRVRAACGNAPLVTCPRLRQPRDRSAVSEFGSTPCKGALPLQRPARSLSTTSSASEMLKFHPLKVAQGRSRCGGPRWAIAPGGSRRSCAMSTAAQRRAARGGSCCDRGRGKGPPHLLAGECARGMARLRIVPRGPCPWGECRAHLAEQLRPRGHSWRVLPLKRPASTPREPGRRRPGNLRGGLRPACGITPGCFPCCARLLAARRRAAGHSLLRQTGGVGRARCALEELLGLKDRLPRAVDAAFRDESRAAGKSSCTTGRLDAGTGCGSSQPRCVPTQGGR